MKKLLTILGSAGLVVSTGVVLVSCATDPNKIEMKNFEIKNASFDVEVEPGTIKINSVKAEGVSQPITVFKLGKDIGLGDDNKTITGSLVAPKSIPDGKYKIVFSALPIKPTDPVDPEKTVKDEPQKEVFSKEFELVIGEDQGENPGDGTEQKELSVILIKTELSYNSNDDKSLPTKDNLGKEVEDGILIQAVIDTNEGFTMNDGNVKAGSIKLNLDTHTGEAMIVGAGNYKGEVKVTFKFSEASAPIK